MRYLLTFLLSFLTVFVMGQTAPSVYYTFDEANPLSPTVGSTNLSGGGTYSVSSGGVVGKYLEWETPGAADNLIGETVNSTFQATIQFWFKAGYFASAVRNATILRNWGTISLVMQYPNIIYTTGTQEFKITLDGIGRKSWGYWNDGAWHHVALVINGNIGRKELWIDGQLPTGFSVAVPTGAINTSSIRFNHDVDYAQYYGALDEIAYYSTALSSRQIYQNYTESAAGAHYTTALASSVPAADPVTAAVDLNEYAPGFPTGYTVTALQQLDSFPLPRYGWNHGLQRNFNWADPYYMGGYKQVGTSDIQAAHTMKQIQSELATNWNYMLLLSTGTTSALDSSADLANTETTIPLSIITLRAQTPGGAQIWNQSKPKAYFLQDSLGNYLDYNGAITTAPHYWRPTAPTAPYLSDGVAWYGIVDAYSSVLTRDINFVNENDEVFTLYADAAINNDSVVNAAQEASGLDEQDYLASRVSNNDTLCFRDTVMAATTVNDTAKYTEYKIDGHRTDNFRYEYKRKTMTPFGEKYYATGDFYPRWPYNWRYWTGPFHGWQWTIESRYYEFAVNDSLWSPFVAAGWDQFNEANNIRSAQWLGLLKVLGSTGVDFFYTGYFNDARSYNPPNPPPADPAGYAYQLACVPYAQAIVSRYQGYLTGGDLMEGDVPDSYVVDTLPGYSFYAGSANKLVTARQIRGANQYVISGTLQNLSNQEGNEPEQDTATIVLDGDTLTFMIRRQGSVYIYDSTATPIFWQLDGWHEFDHPYYWSSDFSIEAENYDSSLVANIGRVSVRPDVDQSDWTNFTTYITYDAAGVASYGFQPRKTSALYAFVKARSSDGTSVDMDMDVDGSGTATVECITDTNWTWYAINNADGLMAQYSVDGDSLHWFNLTASSEFLQVDQILLTEDSTTYQPGVTLCGAPSASITASGATTFCDGDSVILTANVASEYEWNTGATTRAITVTESGSYTVTVTFTGAGSATSAAEVVTVDTVPSIYMRVIGDTAFCYEADSALLIVVTNAPTYLWSTGATTDSIYADTSGTYVVTVTASNGCMASASQGIFSPDCTCPAPDSLTAVGYAITALLDWEDVDEATAYILTLRNDQTLDSLDITFSFSQAYLTHLDPDTQYSYTIISWCNGLAMSEPSRRGYFRTRH